MKEELADNCKSSANIEWIIGKTNVDLFDSEAAPVNDNPFYCQPCQEDDVIHKTSYTINLPVFYEVLLTALQSTTDLGVYATFDPATETILKNYHP